MDGLKLQHSVETLWLYLDLRCSYVTFSVEDFWGVFTFALAVSLKDLDDYAIKCSGSLMFREILWRAFRGLVCGCALKTLHKHKHCMLRINLFYSAQDLSGHASEGEGEGGRREEEEGGRREGGGGGRGGGEWFWLHMLELTRENKRVGERGS